MDVRLRSNWTDIDICFTFGMDGHTSRWCRNNNLNRNIFQYVRQLGKGQLP